MIEKPGLLFEERGVGSPASVGITEMMLCHSIMLVYIFIIAEAVHQKYNKKINFFILPALVFAMAVS